MFAARTLVALVLACIPLGAQHLLYTYQGTGAPLGDTDGDGVRDYLIAPSGPSGLLQISGRDGRVLRTLPRRWIPESPIGDVDRDGFDDVLLWQSAEIAIYSGRTGTLLLRLPGPLYGWYAVTSLDDVNGDGVPDLLALGGEWTLEILSGANGSVLFSLPAGGAPRFYLVRLGDVDGDGVGDFATEVASISPPSPTKLSIYSGASRQIVWQGAGDIEAMQSDLDGDGRAEYLVTLQGYHTPDSVMLYSGTGSVIHSWSGVAFGVSGGDLDGDGIEDVLTSDGLETIGFSGRTFARIWSVPRSLVNEMHALGDLDGDGRGEVLLNGTIYSGNPVDFTGSQAAASVGTAVTQYIVLTPPPQHAGKVYWVLGSLSGTAPGFRLGGLTVPLQLDPYTLLTAQAPFAGLILLPVGVLSPAGVAAAVLTLPPLPSVFAGLTFHHAYVVLGAGTVDYVSRQAPLALY